MKFLSAILAIIMAIYFFQIVSSQATPPQRFAIYDVQKDCVGTADAKDLTKNLKPGRVDFIDTKSLVDGSNQVLDCKAGMCAGAASNKCSTDQKEKFQPESKACCVRFEKKNGKITCVEGGNKIKSTQQVKSKLEKIAPCTPDQNKQNSKMIDSLLPPVKGDCTPDLSAGVDCG